ncbi:MAG: hypothetical protein J0649_04385 [Methylococcales bacterium]|nr:hypothetical protein [Methylococcales bacterium]
MPDQHPSTFCKDFTEENLQLLSNCLLQVRHDVFQLMQDPLDDNYTRECAAFSRSRNAIIAMCKNLELPQFSLINGGMDVTFCIGNSIPIRFYRDDPHNPQKSDRFRQKSQNRELFPTNDQAVLFAMLVVEDLNIDGTEPCAYFIGFNKLDEKLFRWCSKESVSIASEIDESVPQSVSISDPVLEKKDTQSQQKKNKKKN